MTLHESIAALKTEVPIADQVSARVAYLKDEISEWIVRTWEEMERHSDYLRRGKVMEQILTAEEIQLLNRKIYKSLQEIYRERRRLSGVEPELTDDMISRAKAYPFAELIVFSANRAACPFHKGDGRTALQLLHNNRVVCHSGCGGKSYDPIDYMMLVEGCTFKAAVKRLS